MGGVCWRAGRRATLRAALAAAGVWATEVVLGACGPGGPRPGTVAGSQAGAAPTGGSAPVTLQWAEWGGWPAYGGPHWQEFVRPAADYFEQQHPGIRLQLVPPGGGGSFLPAILAGTAPDVFQDWAIGLYRAAGAVLPLDPYLRRDNLDVSLWSPGQMYAMRDEQGIQFLPCYVHVTTMAVNLSILDNLGLPYPDPGWTYEEAARLFRSCARDVNGKRQYGVALYFNGQDMGDPHSMRTYVFHWFGGAEAAPDRLTCRVAEPASYAGVQWVDELRWDNVLSPNEGSADLQNIAFVEAGSNALVRNLQNWSNKFKWTFFPMPHFPAGQYSFEATDFYAINAGTKHPDEAWTLLRWLAADPYWSRYCMHYLLRTPSLVSLWEEYAKTVEAVAPVVQGKGMQYYTQAAQRWGIANTVFRYSQSQVVNILNAQLGRAAARQASVPEAMAAAAQQINALEAAGALEEARATQAVQRFPTNGPSVAAVPAGV
jgi:multiple sugar transport system substrate-binding protein